MYFIKKFISQKSIRGGIDTITPSRISGWVACENCKFHEVKLFWGNKLISKTSIDRERQDVVNELSINGNHGFDLFLPKVLNLKKKYWLDKVRIFAISSSKRKTFNLRLFKDSDKTISLIESILKSDLIGKDGFIDGIKDDGKIYGWAGTRDSKKSSTIWLKIENTQEIEIRCEGWRSGLEMYKISEFSGFCLDPYDKKYEFLIGKEVKFYFDKECKYVIPQNSSIFIKRDKKENIAELKKITELGNLDGFSNDNEVIIGWKISSNNDKSIWLSSNDNKYKLKLISSKYRLDRAMLGENPYCGFEIQIDSLPAYFEKDNILCKVTHDKNGNNLLNGIKQPFKIPKIINNKEIIEEKFKYNFNDNLNSDLIKKIELLNLYGGFYKNWYSFKNMKSEPVSYEVELSILRNYKNNINQLNPHQGNYSGPIYENNELVLPELKECDDRYFKIYSSKLFSNDAALIPEDFSPEFRQRLINDSKKSDYSISVIIPSWNREKSLLRSIDSALNQTLKPMEVILSDDGSTDNSLMRVKECFSAAISNKKLKIIKSKHLGVSHARNLALEISNGDFLSYLDSDNTWHPDHLLFLAYFLKKNKTKSDLIYSTRRLYGSRVNGKILPIEIFEYKKLLINNFIDLNCVLHKKELYNKEGGFDPNLKRLVDWDLVLKYTNPDRTNAKVQHLNIATVNYWRNKNMLSNISVSESWQDAFNIIQNKYVKKSKN